MGKEPKTCEICGKPVPKGRRRYCSEDCMRKMEARRNKELRKDRPKWRAYRWLVCQDCGKKVWRPIKSIRCEGCQEEARKKYAAEYRERKAAGRSRIIGEKYPCEACGKMYVLDGSLQRYCQDCREENVTKNMRKLRREWNKKAYGTEEGKAKLVQMRSKQSFPIVRECEQCGKKFETLTISIYCSEECREKAKQAYYKAYDEARKEKRSEQAKAKWAAMTPEQREEFNRKAREYYAKRKEKVKKEEE